MHRYLLHVLAVAIHISVSGGGLQVLDSMILVRQVLPSEFVARERIDKFSPQPKGAQIVFPIFECVTLHITDIATLVRDANISRSGDLL